jgi:UDP-N-acetylglucosamine:LPS N-acetylglucosamine transferase
MSGNRVLVISVSVGAGHDGAAEELVRRLRLLGVDADLRDFLDALPRTARVLYRQFYRLSVGWAPGVYDWGFHGLERSGWVQQLTFLMCRVAGRRIRHWIPGHAVVVSTHPMSSQTLGQLKEAGSLRAATVTYLTDPAVHRTWVHPAIDHHLTVTEATARMGQVTYQTPMQAVGGLVPPQFARPASAARRREIRAELGVSQDVPVALVVAGSLGLGSVPRAVRAIGSSGIAQVVVLCGRNKRLRRQLSGLDGVVAVGWRDDVADLMSAADVLIHNAGGLSLTEAMTAGLPAVTFCPIPGHGAANAEVLAQAGLAPWPQDEAALLAAVLAAAGRRGEPGHVVRDPDAAQFVHALLTERQTAAAAEASEPASWS